ncbi:MAG: glycosyltransferase family 2 protein [Bernardetiaceae bacterium]|nr:glycosyltransferase family 2 protein [Bernardetiaceae bacterium]
MRNKVSAIITTFNEAHNLREAIQSIEWADEIIVVDSFSTDSTLEIANELADKVLQRKYEDPASQKNWAIPQAQYEWIFILDADERVSLALANEIKLILDTETIDCDAFDIPRLNIFMNKTIRYSGWQGDSVIRLFKKSCRYESKKVHEEIITKGIKVKKLKEKLVHHTYKDIKHHLYKLDKYTSWKAEEHIKKNKRITFFHLYIKPVARFIRQYILKLGILDGKVGLIIAWFSAYSVFLSYLKAWRMLNGEKI